jgi:hypothetical protein
MKIKILLVSLAIFFLINKSRAQNNVITQNMIWYGYYFQFPITEKWYLVSEIQERHFVDPFAQLQFLVRTHAHRKMGKGWETGIGFTASFLNPKAEFIVTVPELRPNLELAFQHKFQKITFDHRLTVEARFFHRLEEDLSALADGYYFQSFRWRYRFQLSFPLSKIGEKGKLKLKVSDEIMLKSNFKFNNQILDQNRIYTAFNLETGSSFTYEVGYLNSYLKRVSDGFYNRNIIRLNVIHKINSKPK